VASCAFDAPYETVRRSLARRLGALPASEPSPVVKRRRWKDSQTPEGGGKSGGFRTIILVRIKGHSFFVHGFAKSDKANVSAKALKALKPSP
jgi:hypothetical protein